MLIKREPEIIHFGRMCKPCFDFGESFGGYAVCNRFSSGIKLRARKNKIDNNVGRTPSHSAFIDRLMCHLFQLSAVTKCSIMAHIQYVRVIVVV